MNVVGEASDVDALLGVDGVEQRGHVEAQDGVVADDEAGALLGQVLEADDLRVEQPSEEGHFGGDDGQRGRRELQDVALDAGLLDLQDQVSVALQQRQQPLVHQHQQQVADRQQISPLRHQRLREPRSVGLLQPLGIRRRAPVPHDQQCQGEHHAVGDERDALGQNALLVRQTLDQPLLVRKVQRRQKEHSGRHVQRRNYQQEIVLPINLHHRRHTKNPNLKKIIPGSVVCICVCVCDFHFFFLFPR